MDNAMIESEAVQSTIVQESTQYVTILGATGTIGTQTLDVISQHPERFKVFALTASSNVKGLFELCRQYKPRYAVMLQTSAAAELGQQFKAAGIGTIVLHGDEALTEVAAHPQVGYCDGCYCRRGWIASGNGGGTRWEADSAC